ncbi:UDP-N-acetylmuramate--L-alanine ligase [Candidatus Amesbacteria bacterium RIFCSPHIGHO2_01_FULL_48_32]|uniref:UDP-N-acetylmuramate--L-alanine ligase n=1 Tax=Candidatus Amesbacteria bacterium RIFCSPLOWO2_01_FULL_48_25 TaxID=1797259 RepID=A0A1F4ZDF3_9BACT|nr:MAG: UDP-N-acetylmuramate--L-alanine ligase [Candidatus Amesbacteria bacterium RIFCSPHIGHO2_01_FULL_48_32]OGD04303.1 MAG: UDP-N-acetylmuramate--L-alanine ligase [Candidatus Amesbacteria bacterium RIFCSPLOWO2_01_FULL_48_25]HJZ05504.1 UDP-N-acetylmuramate--L-alanine ligase [Patescibacteria group bacterium]
MSPPISSLKNVNNIYFLGIAGQLMSALACVAKDFGYHITGSDENAYPPATTYLESSKITWISGHKPENIGHPDLVVLGNHIRQGNPELEALLESKIPFVSYPQMVRLLFPNAKYRLVVAGTHGKSTTTSLLGWILTQAGLNPTVLIGAQSKNFNSSFRLGSKEILVIEGDEYTSSCLDNTPKFLYYEPTHAILTSAELDHMDVFNTWEKQATAFTSFAKSVSQMLIVCGDTLNGNKLSLPTKAKVEKYGLGEFDWQATNIHFSGKLTKFDVSHHEKLLGTFSMHLSGKHYIQDSLSAIALAHHTDIPTHIIQKSLLTFKGVGKRFEVVYDKGITIIDDYAHHPTAIKVTLEAASSRYPSRRLWAIYEPHTFTRVKGLLPQFAHCFDPADIAIIADIMPAREKALTGLVHSRDIVATAKNHPDIHYLATPDEILAYLKQNLKPNDVFVFMSVGKFGDLPKKLSEFITIQ